MGAMKMIHNALELPSSDTQGNISGLLNFTILPNIGVICLPDSSNDIRVLNAYQTVRAFLGACRLEYFGGFCPHSHRYLIRRADQGILDCIPHLTGFTGLL